MNTRYLLYILFKCFITAFAGAVLGFLFFDHGKPDIAKDQIQDKCISDDYLLNRMLETGEKNKTFIIILDKCRSNPFRGLMRGNDENNEWGVTKNRRSSYIIAYPSLAGQPANDGYGNNGLYTSVLLKYLREKGLSIFDLFIKVINEISEQYGEQVPQESVSLTRNFYFNP